MVGAGPTHTASSARRVWTRDLPPEPPCPERPSVWHPCWDNSWRWVPDQHTLPRQLGACGPTVWSKICQSIIHFLCQSLCISVLKGKQNSFGGQQFFVDFCPLCSFVIDVTICWLLLPAPLSLTQQYKNYPYLTLIISKSGKCTPYMYLEIVF